MNQIQHLSFAAALSLCAAGTASAADVLVTSDIAVSTTWTANNVYKLEQQIYVLPGATLTIEPGTIVASRTNVGGSLAVSRGAQILALGTKEAPIIFTSEADVATWVNGDPRTGTWRESANEWGNITLMGRGYISENATVGNTPAPAAGNFAAMEGLVASFPGDQKVLYGGGNDDDDSGTLSYVSLRYGGRVVGLNNELNGLSVGGVGRGTDIHHIEIMNNVDDGIEIWGGAVNLKHFAIWNIGDDSLDIDQGWRGKAQFGLIVQGHSLDASQGSGVGDNCMEMDGAEDSDWQPVTTATIYNMTVIGQPVDGDHGTAWRDNARVQIRNSIFMDLGDRAVSFDNVDGDGANGYGFNGTLSWADTWTTSYTATSTVNAPANPAAFYMTQTSGNLAEITDSVFFRNLGASAYTEANNRGVFAASNNNVLIPGFNNVDAPVASVTRGAAVVRGGKTILPVIGLDPRPANAALTSVASAPNDGFFTPANYRGAFAPGNGPTWLCGWTASDAFGFTSGDCIGANYCTANANSTGQTGVMSAAGSNSVAANDLQLTASNLPNNAFAFFIVSRVQGFIANPGGSSGNICLGGAIGRGAGGIVNTAGTGRASVSVNLNSIPQPTGNVPVIAGETWNFQCWHRDSIPGGGATSNFSDAYSITFQ
ncbi:MAG: hypothetical protein R3F49_21010 [Planctomycetota bacterium]